MISEEVKQRVLEALNKVEPLTTNQKKLWDVLHDETKSIVGIFGPSGTGKTFLVLCYGIRAVLQEKYRRLVIIRPVVNTLTRERVPQGRPDIAKQYVYDVLGRYLSPDIIDKLFEAGILEVHDPFFLRGRSFEKSCVFVDDAHALTPAELFEVMMHVGIDSRLIYAADPVLQETVREDGARALRAALEKEEDVAFVDLGLEDIVRPGARRAVWLLLKSKLRLKPLSEDEKKMMESLKKHAPDARVITVLDLRALKKEHEIKGETPDFLIIADTGHVGRVIGRGGKRIQEIEKEFNARVKVTEFVPNSKTLENIFLAVHPVPGRIRRALRAFDIRGCSIVVVADEKSAGILYGRGGAHIRLCEDAFELLFGLPLKVELA